MKFHVLVKLSCLIGTIQALLKSFKISGGHGHGRTEKGSGSESGSFEGRIQVEVMKLDTEKKDHTTDYTTHIHTAL